MRSLFVLVFVFLSANSFAAERFAPETPVLNVGAPEIDSSRLTDFEFTWVQMARQEDSWVERGRISESLKRDGAIRRHQQEITLPGDISIVATTLFDATTLFAQSVNKTINGAPADRPATIDIAYNENGYVQATRLGNGESISHSLHTAVTPFASQAFGLVVAALPLEKDYRARLPVAFPQLQMWYWIELVVVDEKTEQFNGRDVSLFIVDAHWMNVSDGAIYPGGADQSGGQYHVVKRGGGSLPHVWRYRNDNVDIRPARPESG